MSKKINFNELFSLIDIILVIGTKINLKKKGENFWGICPFHKDTSPSLSVSKQKDIFKCFSCGVSGNAVSFLQKYENLTFFSALKEALILSNVDSSIINNINNNLKFSANDKIYLINKQVMNLMNNYLLMSIKKNNVETFLQKRKINKEDIIEFNLGYIDESYLNNFYDNLFNFCKENFSDEVPDDLLRKINLFTFNEEKKELKLFFNNRIIFPILDKNVNVVGFSGRDLSDHSNAKYINSPESNFFIKGNILYNYYSLNNNLENNHIILVEGYMDVITLVSNGYKSTVGTMGTSLTSAQLQLISDLKNLKQIILSFDNDDAGKQAFLKNLTNILDYQKNLNTFIPVYISGLFRSEFKDADELFKKINKENAKKIFDESENGLFIAAIFKLNIDNNIEFNLNESLKYILSYKRYNFGLYVDNALNLFKDYLIKEKNILKEQIDELIQKLSKIKYVDNSYNKKTYKARQNKNIISKSDRERELYILKINRFINLLNENYIKLMFVFLYFPYEAISFVKKCDEDNYLIELLNNDRKFVQMNNKLIKSNLFDYISINSKEFYQFINFVYLIYIYIDSFDIDKLREKEYIHNLNYLLNGSSFLNALSADDNFYGAKGIKKYLSEQFLEDISLHKFDELTNMNSDEIIKLCKILFSNIWRLLSRIYLFLNFKK